MSDTTLVALNAILNFALALLAIEMSLHPPKNPWKFRAIFIVIAIASVRTSIVQWERATSAQSAAQQQIHTDELASQAKINALQGGLDAVKHFLHQGAPSALDGKRIDDSVKQVVFLSTLSNDALEGKEVDVRTRLQEKLLTVENQLDVGFEDKFDIAETDGQRRRIQQDRNRMRAQFAAVNKPLVAEASTILAVLEDRPPLTSDHDDLQSVIQRFERATSQLPVSGSH